jgi:hypothetical protein
MQLCARVPSPFGVHPSARKSVVFFPGPCITRLRRFFLPQAEDFLPHFAAVGGVSRFILQLRDQ